MIKSKFIFASVAVFLVSSSMVLGGRGEEDDLFMDDIGQAEQQDDVYFTNQEDDIEDNNEDIDYEGSTSSGISGDFSDNTHEDCRCWIGQQYDKSNMYFDLGIPSRILFNDGGLKICANRCIKRCNDFFFNKRYDNPIRVKNALCIALDKEIELHPSNTSVGCFSQLGYNDTNQNIWNSVIKLPKLRCKLRSRDCVWMFGDGYKYHAELGRCVRTLIENDPSCIAGVQTSDNTHPVCCHGGTIYSCVKPMQIAESY